MAPLALLYRVFFFFNDTATTEIYTLSLHDALPISAPRRSAPAASGTRCRTPGAPRRRSEEHTSELQSRQYLVCRLLLEKKTSASSLSPRPRRRNNLSPTPSSSRTQTNPIVGSGFPY